MNRQVDIDIPQLASRCADASAAFHEEGDVVFTDDDGLAGFYVFQDNGCRVLAVCHLDTVHPYRGYQYERQHDRLWCSTLDNRLGAYLMLDFLPDLGLSFDVLLTDHEETGRSTARFFAPPREYNWIFSFDAPRNHVKMYDYASRDSLTLLHSYGFVPVHHLIASDICSLPQQSCKAFNIGCGVSKMHSKKYAHANLAVARKSMGQFVDFFQHYENRMLPHPDGTELDLHALKAFVRQLPQRKQRDDTGLAT
jgi:hypothetical protein